MRGNILFTLAIILGSWCAFSFPQWFIDINGLETKSLILPMLMLIMFAMGTHTSLRDFMQVWRRPKAVGLGISLQFIIMPISGFALAYFSELPNEVAAGILLVGCSPSGLASNVMCFIAKANLALSVSLTTCATLLAPFITPLLMATLAKEYVQIDATAMFVTTLKLVIVPVCGGMLVNHFMPKRIHHLLDWMPRLAMVGIILIVAIIVANGQESLAQIGATLVLIVAIHNLLGFALGYTAAKMMKLDEAACRSLAFEVGMQNSGLASGIALTMNKIATMGLAAALFSSIQNVSGSVLASIWASRKTTPYADI